MSYNINNSPDFIQNNGSPITESSTKHNGGTIRNGGSIAGNKFSSIAPTEVAPVANYISVIGNNTATSQLLSAITSSEVSYPQFSYLSNGDRLLESINKIVTQKVDFVGMGDSNQARISTGWDHGWQYALHQSSLPQHASHFMTPYENNGAGAGLGYKIGSSPLTVPSSSGAPTGVGKYFGYTNPLSYGYFATSGVVQSASNGLGLIIDADSALDVNANLRFEFHYGTFASGSGGFQPGVRRHDSPFTALATTSGGKIFANTGEGVAMAYFDLPAATRNHPLLAGFGSTATNPRVDVSGPLLCGYIRAINMDVSTGWSYTTWLSRSGETMRNFAIYLQNQPDETLTYFFENIRRIQNADVPCIIICINTGINDKFLSSTSVGPNPNADGDSPEAYGDNLEAIILRIKEIFDLNNWDFENEVTFICSASHSISEPVDSELDTYQEQIAILGNTYSNVCGVDLHELFPQQDIIDITGYSDPVSDKIHLNVAGYQAVSSRLMDDVVLDELPSAGVTEITGVMANNNGVIQITSSAELAVGNPILLQNNIISGVYKVTRDLGNNQYLVNFKYPNTDTSPTSLTIDILNTTVNNRYRTQKVTPITYDATKISKYNRDSYYPIVNNIRDGYWNMYSGMWEPNHDPVYTVLSENFGQDDSTISGEFSYRYGKAIQENYNN